MKYSEFKSRVRALMAQRYEIQGFGDEDGQEEELAMGFADLCTPEDFVAQYAKDNDLKETESHVLVYDAMKDEILTDGGEPT